MYLTENGIIEFRSKIGAGSNEMSYQQKDTKTFEWNAMPYIEINIHVERNSELGWIKIC